MYRLMSLFLLQSAPVLAASPLTQDVSAVKSWLISSLLVIVVGAVVFVLARKKQLSAFRLGGQIQVLSTLSLGMKEKLILVQVEEQRFLLGVTPQQITLISALDQSSATGEAPTFAQLMKTAEASPLSTTTHT